MNILKQSTFINEAPKTTAHWKHLSMLLGLNIIILSFFSWILPIRFETNDDVTMLLLASGKITGTPEAHLVYINYILGYLLTKCYTICNNIEWYTIFLFSIHICSFTIIIWQILLKKSSTLMKGLSILLFYSIEIRLLLCFQFTTTAALAAVAGLLLITKTSWIQKIMGLMLFLFAVLLRFEAAYLVCIVFSPFYVTLIYPFKKSVFYKSLIIIFAGFILIMASQYLNFKAYQQSSDWKYFYDCEQYRGFIPDNTNAYTINNQLPVSKNDFSLYMKFLVDTKIFSLPIMKQMAQNIDHVPFFQKLQHIIPTYHAYLHLLFLLGIICFVIIGNAPRNRETVILLLSSFIFIAVFSFIALDGQIKYRVFITALLPLLLIFALHSSNNFKPLVIYSLSILILLFCLDFSNSTYSIWKEHKQEKIAFIEQKQIVDSFLEDSSHRLLPFYDRLAIENCNPFHVSDQMHFNQIINSGWMAYYPYNRKVFPSFKSFSEGLDIFILKNDTGIISKIGDRLKNNYAILVKPNVVMQSTKYTIIQFNKQ